MIADLYAPKINNIEIDLGWEKYFIFNLIKKIEEVAKGKQFALSRHYRPDLIGLNFIGRANPGYILSGFL
jgi:hypothetical protein